LALLAWDNARAQTPEMPDPFFRPMPQAAPEVSDPWSRPAPRTPPQRPPLSTSGTDIVPAARPAIVRADPSLSRRLRALEQKVADLGHENAPPADSLAAWSRRIRLSAFVQPQFVASIFNAAASPNVDPSGSLGGFGANDTLALPNGDTTNAIFFRMRRARLRLDADLATWVGIERPMVRLVFEIEPIPRTRGIPESGTFLRQTEAQLWLPWKCASKDCTLETILAGGLMRLPFGYELLEPETVRPFVERSFGVESMFPGQFDLGVRADTKALSDRLSFTIALLNGRTIGEQQGSVVPDLNRGKDGVARLHLRTDVLGAGVSGYAGIGQRVDGATLQMKTFPRWALGADLELHHVFDPAVGETRAIVEGVLGANMDRGLVYPFALPDIPADIKQEVDARNEASLSVRLEQDTTRWLTWAVRADAYTPNTRLPDDMRITGSISASLHITRHLRLVLEYDHARDTIRPDDDSPKPFRHVSQGSAMLEARF
jgi:hypothetical protein